MSLRAGIAQCTIGLTLAIGLLLSPSPALAQKFEVKQVTEKRLKELPSGTLYWQIEDFPTLAQAEAAVGPTSLAAEYRRGERPCPEPDAGSSANQGA